MCLACNEVRQVTDSRGSLHELELLLSSQKLVADAFLDLITFYYPRIINAKKHQLYGCTVVLYCVKSNIFDITKYYPFLSIINEVPDSCSPIPIHRLLIAMMLIFLHRKHKIHLFRLLNLNSEFIQAEISTIINRAVVKYLIMNSTGVFL